MSDFSIEIQPEPPATTKLWPEVDFDVFDVAETLKIHPEMYDLTYVIDGKRFGYYPSSIMMAMSDIYSELDLVRSGIFHYISVGGYEVLEVHPADSLLRFHSLTNEAALSTAERFIAAIPRLYVERCLVAKGSALVDLASFNATTDRR